MKFCCYFQEIPPPNCQTSHKSGVVTPRQLHNFTVILAYFAFFVNAYNLSFTSPKHFLHISRISTCIHVQFDQKQKESPGKRFDSLSLFSFFSCKDLHFLQFFVFLRIFCCLMRYILDKRQIVSTFAVPGNISTHATLSTA